MAVEGDVHVSDIGTLYKAKIQNMGQPFPEVATAVVKKFIFKTPQGVFERDATVLQEGSDYFLTYTVVPGDVEELHGSKGKVSWQGFISFTGGEQYHTNIEDFVIEKNLN